MYIGVNPVVTLIEKKNAYPGQAVEALEVALSPVYGVLPGVAPVAIHDEGHVFRDGTGPQNTRTLPLQPGPLLRPLLNPRHVCIQQENRNIQHYWLVIQSKLKHTEC